MSRMINVLEYLEETVKKFPDKCAYKSDKDEMTFKQVYDEAQRIGTFLINKGMYKKPVAVSMEKSPQMITAFLGIVYAGCYYVTLDGEMPEGRMRLILDQIQPEIMICDSALKDEDSICDGALKDEDSICDGALKDEDLICDRASQDDKSVQISRYSYNNLIKSDIDNAKINSVRNTMIDTDLLYVVFTSGSTGIPKGVAANHRSVIDYIEQLSDVLKVDENTIFGNQAPFFVDACLKEIYPTLKCAATAVIIPKQLFMFPVKLVDFLNEYKINTICWVVPALTMISGLGAFKTVVPQYLKCIAFGSEVFPVKQLNMWKEKVPQARFINLYGPTEATGMSCYYIVDKDFDEIQTIPIGKPFKNTDIFLIDENGSEIKAEEITKEVSKEVSEEVTKEISKENIKNAQYTRKGEIYIRGTAVTCGYYKAFEKTNENFVQNPLNNIYPEIVYKTGDLGYYDRDGNLYFASRKDFQIKHMGHRIELGEIETAASRCKGVGNVCCVYIEEKKKIVLYYTGDVAWEDVYAFCKNELMRYMLPSEVIKLDKMPLTLNGKTDRKCLIKIWHEKHAK